MADINRLIALNPFQSPSVVDKYAGGVALGRQRQQQMAQEQQQRQQMEQQANIGRMMQMGASIPDIARAGGIQQAQALSEIQRRQTQSDVDRGKLGIQKQELGLDRDRYGLQKQKLEMERNQPKENDKEFLKEIRAQSYKAVSGFNKRAAEISGAYGKVKGLAGQAAKPGNRQARAAMIMNVARLISPGVVTDKDFSALAGGSTPIAEIMNVIAGRSPDVAGLIRTYDPTGEAFDVNGLLDVAKSVTTAETPSLIQSYESAAEMAQRSQMNPRQYKTIFGDNKNVKALTELIAEPVIPEPVQEQPQPQTRARTRTVEEVDKGSVNRIRFDSQGNIIQ